MLTRLEAHGFKNLINFSVDFGPVTGIAGPNGVGKSNVFDAVVFLSHLTEHTLLEAALLVREDTEFSDLRDLFWTDGVQRMRSFRLAVEMLVDEEVEDDFGRQAKATSTLLRYELEIGYEPPDLEKKGPLGRLVLLKESLDYITKTDSKNHLRFPHSASRFRDDIVLNNRRSNNGYISTRQAEDITEILIHGDGGSRGKPQRSNASHAPRTIIGTSNTSDTPTILAARAEMRSWSILALEPTAMRQPSRFHDPSVMTPHGGHLPAVLYRLAQAEAEDDEALSSAVLARLTNRLSELVPVNGVLIERDDSKQLLTITVKEGSGLTVPARSLSDGTLRFLALCILVEDSTAMRVICMEEPENGIHPARLENMVDLLCDIAVDPDEPPSSDNPLRQVIFATHSPSLVQLMDDDDLLFATHVRIPSPFDPQRAVPVLRCLPLRDTWRARDSAGIPLSKILAYLTSPPNAQVSLTNLMGEVA